jgi:hypothetical protein
MTGALCKLTSIAHMSYHDDNPLKDAIELCQSCHMRYDHPKGGAPPINVIKDMSNRKCFSCQRTSDQVRKRVTDGRPIWLKGPVEDSYLCADCYHRSWYMNIGKQRRRRRRNQKLDR